MRICCTIVHRRVGLGSNKNDNVTFLFPSVEVYMKKVCLPMLNLKYERVDAHTNQPNSLPFHVVPSAQGRPEALAGRWPELIRMTVPNTIPRRHRRQGTRL